MNTHIAKTTALAALLALLAVVPASSASAQATTPREGEQVDNKIKGTIGLGMIGAEVGLLVPGLTGLTDWWSWVTFPTLGAAGGAVAGIFIFDNGSGSPQAAVAMLGVGIGLVVPSTVLALALAARDPMDELEDERAMSPRKRKQLAIRRGGSGLVRFTPEGTFVAPPGVSPVVGRTATGRRARGSHVSLFSGRF